MYRKMIACAALLGFAAAAGAQQINIRMGTLAPAGSP